jgi:protein-arginine kinase activator protein McsA
MKCERCEVRDAEVHFTTIRDTEARTEHLCQVCSGGTHPEDPLQAIKRLYDFMLSDSSSLSEEEREIVRRLSEAMLQTPDETREPLPPADPETT